jgi:hypothetical protein
MREARGRGRYGQKMGESSSNCRGDILSGDMLKVEDRTVEQEEQIVWRKLEQEFN